MSRRRKALIYLVATLALGLVFATLHDLVLYRSWSILSSEYSRVSEESALERGLRPGELTTSEADSGCLEGEAHLCGYQRLVLAEVIEVRPQPC